VHAAATLAASGECADAAAIFAKLREGGYDVTSAEADYAFVAGLNAECKKHDPNA
jgi:hypothetical protein